MNVCRVLGLSCTFVVAALALSRGEARGADHLKRVGVGGGFAGVAGNEGSFGGYGGWINGGYGLTDAWVLAANVMASSNQVSAKSAGGRSLVLSEALGVEYTLDALQFVPYFGVLAAVYEIRGGGVRPEANKVGVQVALGLDYIYSRDFTFGIDFRAHALPRDFVNAPQNPMPFYATTFLKVEYTWGWLDL